MKMRIYTLCLVILLGSAITRSMDNPTECIKNRSYEEWLHLFVSNNVSDRKAKRCAQLLANLLNSYPEIAINIAKSLEQPVIFPMPTIIWNEFCNKIEALAATFAIEKCNDILTVHQYN